MKIKKVFEQLERINKLLKHNVKLEFVFVDYEADAAEHRFTDYKDFANYIEEEYNSAKEILSADVEDRKITVEWFGKTYTYVIYLDPIE